MSIGTAQPVPSSGFTSRAPATATIRPAGPADTAALGDFFAALPLQTRYLRFFAPVRPTPPLLRVLSGGGANIDAMVAVQDGVIIGHAMAAGRPGTEGSRHLGAALDPQEPAVTDIGVVVADTWQGRGVGSALVRALLIRAQARGVTSMTMEVLHANHRALSMIKRRWPTAEIDRSAEYATIRVRLPRSEQLLERNRPGPAQFSAALPSARHTSVRSISPRRPAAPATGR
jgi:ribosomal protein S18 acetylase RimI-like enzyme